jgi:hypothetical protein
MIIVSEAVETFHTIILHLFGWPVGNISHNYSEIVADLNISKHPAAAELYHHVYLVRELDWRMESRFRRVPSRRCSFDRFTTESQREPSCSYVVRAFRSGQD